jgi:2-keto-4-pentenoate hydratase/2-oxohepta-3-ene-1,7-dioic acid hydratase in catechol pathway
MQDALRKGGVLKRARVRIDGFIRDARVVDGGFLIEGPEPKEVGRERVTLLPPATPSKILAVGWNFPEHIREMTDMPAHTMPPEPAEPIIFYKPPSSLVGHGEPIVYPAEATRVDHEAELAVVVGSRLRRATPEESRSAVAGWTCANDVTERDMQRRDRQWWRAKGFDTFSVLGPFLETEEPDPSAYIRGFVNGELRQEGRVRDMIRDPYEILSYISQAVTLEPGDVVMLGTPPGVGPLVPGDVVEVEVEGVGVLRNPVTAEVALDRESRS